MKSLVLAEKPSVAKEIARVLGCGGKQRNFYEGSKYVVTWALGHLVTLAEPEDYDPKYRTWTLEDLPMLPERMNLKVMKETSAQFRAIDRLAKRSDLSELIIATDAGREGELVARWIMKLIRWRKPFKRLWISSQTDQAIKEGFAKLRPGKQYDALYESAVCRAEADWLIGLNVTRALTVKYNDQLSAGRVQTPTLAMLLEREREIEQFQSVPYWIVSANFGTFNAKWRKSDGHDGRLASLAEAEALVRKLERKEATVRTVQTKERIEPPPLAYDLTELQRDANVRLGFSAKMTSSVLQRLYEQHKLVTYPRTDSRYLTADMVSTLPARLKGIAVGPYLPLAKPLLGAKLHITKRIVDDSKVTDHHAIIPTEEPVRLQALDADERKLYDLIVKRFLALFYPACTYDVTSVVMEADGERFYARGTILKERGWKQVYGSYTGSGGHDEADDANEADDVDAQELPILRAGQRIELKRCRIDERKTEPPARYSEATLLARMEKHNLGTPATRADIIEKLLSTDTIDRRHNVLVPTPKGKQLIGLVSDVLRSPELTARWERELEQIARGKGDSGQFMAGIREQAKVLVHEIKHSRAEYKPHNVTNSRCPDCGKSLIIKKTKRGRRLVCHDRECGYARDAEPALLNKRCPQCRKKMELREGKAGKFAHCRACNVIEMLDGDHPKGGGRSHRRQDQSLIRKYSDNVSLSSSLGDALRAALQQKEDDD